MYKTGRWSKEENQFIVDNANKLSLEEISKRLNRAPESVKSKIHEAGLHLKGLEAYQYDAEKDLRSSKHWSELQAQLTQEELSFFLAEWKDIVSQFRDDVMATEKLQIIDLIKIGILMNRSLKQQKQVQEDCEMYYALIEAEKQKDMDDRDQQAINSWQMMITTMTSATDSLLKTFQSLAKEKKDILQKLKATREQRIEKLESSKETAAGWFRKVLLEPEKRKAIGERIEKMRIAMGVEYLRLSEMHKYEDGGIDRPILNCESVKQDEE